MWATLGAVHPLSEAAHANPWCVAPPPVKSSPPASEAQSQTVISWGAEVGEPPLLDPWLCTC